jgi:hypothetical protein
MDEERIKEQHKLLATYQHTLAHLLQQAAHYGGEVFAPPHVANGIRVARQSISDIEKILEEDKIQIPPIVHVPTTVSLNELMICIATIDSILKRLNIIKKIIYDDFPGDAKDPEIAVTSTEMFKVDMDGLKILTEFFSADSAQVQKWYVNHPLYTERSTQGQIETYQEKKIVLVNILNAIRLIKE